MRCFLSAPSHLDDLGEVFAPTLDVAQRVLDEAGGPVFLTDARSLANRLNVMKNAFQGQAKIYYALKANYNPYILFFLKKEGLEGVDTVSAYEVDLALKLGFRPEEALYTGNNSSDEEMDFVSKKGVLLNIGSLSELERFGKTHAGKSVSLRLNPGVGTGEFSGVVTGGEDSKFGVRLDDFEKAKSLIKQYRLKLSGIHSHIGSGYYTTEAFQKAVQRVLKEARQFETIEFVNFGGGFGVRYERGKKPIDLESFWASIEGAWINFLKEMGRPIEMRLEPGKFLVGESTCLLVKVTTVSQGKDMPFVGVASGFNHLIRPAFYGAYHEIINLSNPKGAVKKVNVVGNICESSDYLGKAVALNEPREGDTLAIVSSGAYGASMSSLYNLRPYASEFLLESGNLKCIRKTPSLEEALKGLGIDWNGLLEK